MKTNISRNAIAKTRLSNIGVLWIILALTFAACADREADETGAMGGTGEIGTEDDLTGTTGMDAAPVLPVSVMGTGHVMPTLPAGQATFTVNNTGTEDCMLTFIPQTSGSTMMGQGTMGQDTATGMTPGMQGTEDQATGDDQNAPVRREDMAGTDNTTTPSPETQRGMTGQGTMQGQQNTRVAAGQTSTVTVDLEPGMYEVLCDGAGRADQQTPGAMSEALPGMRMLVMVTDAGTGTMGTGLNNPQRGTPATEPSPGTGDGIDSDGANQ